MDFENEVSRKFLIQVLEFLAEDPDDQVRGIARDLLKSLNGSSPSTTAKTP